MRRHFTMNMTGLLVLTSALLLAEPALAEHRHLYVDAAAAQNGDGSRHRPFWRITNAAVRARELRQDDSDPEERIFIHVRPGTYVGSYDPSHLANNPRLELLPIIINVPDLSLEGGTELDEDEDGLPTGTYPLESETLLTTDLPLTRGQVLLLIARTTDGMAGNGVSVSGFVMDAQGQHLPSIPGFDIYADRVSDFSIHDNVLRHGVSGAGTRLASGSVEANFCASSSSGPGIFISGGSMTHPARVNLRRNRSTQNGLGGAGIFAVANFVQLDLGANTLRLEPLQMSYDLNNPEDQQNIPDRLEATVESNDLSDNFAGPDGGSGYGLACRFYPPLRYTTADMTQAMRGTLNVVVSGNRLSRNANYGLIVDPGSSDRSTPRQLTGMFQGAFEQNALIENGRDAAMFAFMNSLGARETFKYMQHSTYQVADLDGELEGFDYDHPLEDPFDGSPVVGNTILYNGEAQPNGILITPRP
jgi:hypothetical protein